MKRLTRECRTYGARGVVGLRSQPLRAGLSCDAPLALMKKCHPKSSDETATSGAQGVERERI